MGREVQVAVSSPEEARLDEAGHRLRVTSGLADHCAVHPSSTGTITP